MYKIEYSNDAEKDLFEIISYLSKKSLVDAKIYLQRCESKIKLLQDNPKMGTSCENMNIDVNCRILKSDKNLVIYKEDENNFTIFIVRIFHKPIY